MTTIKRSSSNNWLFFFFFFNRRLCSYSFLPDFFSVSPIWSSARVFSSIFWGIRVRDLLCRLLLVDIIDGGSIIWCFWKWWFGKSSILKEFGFSEPWLGACSRGSCWVCLKDYSGSVRGREVWDKWILRRPTQAPAVLFYLGRWRPIFREFGWICRWSVEILK